MIEQGLYVLTIPLEGHTANTIVNAFMENVVCIHDIPAFI